MRIRQQVTMTCNGGQVVSDAGLLPIRELDQQLGILAEAARRMPDPRSEKACTHSVEDILTQQVYQILAGGSTINRFLHAFTRREADFHSAHGCVTEQRTRDLARSK